MDIRYMYKGTEFLISEYHPVYDRPYSVIVDLLSYGDEVCIPSAVNGHRVTGLRFQAVKEEDYEEEDFCYSGVRRLILPPDIIIHALYNRNFPDLEEIVFPEVQSTYVFSDGMLYDRGGKRLLLTFKRGLQSDEIRIPAKTEEIGPDAFQYTTVRRILFANPDIIVTENPFLYSEWLEEHKKTGDTLFVGNMVFRHFTTDELVLDSSIKRLSLSCFTYACPTALTTHFIPPESIIDVLDKGGCRRLTITSDYEIQWEKLRKWSGLQEVRLPSHSTCVDRDGVVFDKKKNELVFYPPGRLQTDYMIPEGTVSIGCRAFMSQTRLKKIVFCSSVTGIMPGAFCNCTRLESVLMGSCKIREFPDAGIFNDYGVFEGCRYLTAVEFPGTLLRIGSRAFYNTGLEEQMIVHEGIASIGAYAFSRTHLSRISLPKTLEHISPGAFVDRKSPDPLSVSVYEDTAYGLFEALEYTAFGSGSKNGIRIWQEAEVTFLDQNGEVSDIMHIPKSVHSGFEGMLELAITHRRLDRRIYLRCLEGFNNANEKAAAALRIIEANKDIDGICDALVRKMASGIADGYISDSAEEKLIEFLKKGYLSPDALKSALNKCNEKKMSQASAYILHYLGTSLTETMSLLEL